jgi:hypothetical protein
VDPDKNSHPGAVEARKKLKDAYYRLNHGETKTALALAISKPAQSTATKLSKVISIKPQK